MAEDNEIKPIALANATVLLRKLNEEAAKLEASKEVATIESQGELIPAGGRDLSEVRRDEPEPVSLSDTIISLFQSIDATLLRIEQNFDEMFRQMAIDRLAMLEAKAEAGGDPRPAVRPQQQGTKDDGGLDLGFLLTPLGVLAATIGTAVGVIQGQFNAFASIFKTLMPETSARITKAVGEFSKAVSQRLATARAALSEGMKSITNFFKGIGTSIKESKLVTTIGSKFAALLEPFKRIGTVIDDITGGGKQGGVIGDIIKRFTSISGMLKTFGQTIARVAGIVGKIFAPLAIVITLWDTVKGAFQGWEEGGFIGAIQGAIVGFVTSLITKPLDLLKDGVSWIADKLGFENFSEILDSFSFTEMYQKLADAVFFIPKKIQEFLIDLFSGEVDMDYLKNAFGNIADFAKEALKSILRFVLPNPDSWAAKFIPDAVYEFANAPPPERKQESQQIPAEEDNEINPKRGRVINSNEVSRREQELQQGRKEGTISPSESRDAIASRDVIASRDAIASRDTIASRAFDTPEITSSSESRDAIASRAFDTPEITRIESEEKGLLASLFSSEDNPDVTPTLSNQRQETAAKLAEQTVQREEAKAAQQQSNVNVVNAPNTTTNNVSSQAAFFESPSAVDGLGLSYGG